MNTSDMNPCAFSQPAMPAQAPPPAMPASAIAGSSSQAGQSTEVSATQTAVRPPMKIWPSPPTLTWLTRAGTATAIAAKRSGVMRTSTSSSPYCELSVLAQISLKASSGFLP